MTDDKLQERLAALPSVHELLQSPRLTGLDGHFSRAAVKFAVRQAILRWRSEVRSGEDAPAADDIVAVALQILSELRGGMLRPVFNATGVLLHTNLGRAPLGKAALDEIARLAAGYCSLELDLATGSRGERSAHLRQLLGALTGAEDALVVNNNAAALLLALHTLAKDREVVVSRGELIEIGGSFRIPEILAASGARMIEVGTTNRTRLADYEAAISGDTALLLKAHRSNFAIRGFTEEVSVAQLAALSKKRGTLLLYDLGSGLLRPAARGVLAVEPDAASSIEAGADLVCFSGDKLLGGPQAGILVGRRELVGKLTKAPLMRALRVCKLTYAALGVACRAYLADPCLAASNPTFAALSRSEDELKQLAEALHKDLGRLEVGARVVFSTGQCGGGTLPDVKLPSAAVEILPQAWTGPGRETFAEALHRRLLGQDPAVLAVLREGKLVLDVLALQREDLHIVAAQVAAALRAGGGA